MPMEYLHTMVRVRDLDAALHFYCDLLGLEEVRRRDHEKGRFTLVFLAAPGDVPKLGENDIYAVCQRMMDGGVTINRPPRDGHMAFVRSPDGISIELLQRGDALPPAEPWASMENSGAW
jgi:lactoylglutathione lyase